MSRRAENRNQSHDNRWSRANLSFHLYRNTLLRWTAPEIAEIATPPVVVGALGGSGTRIIGQILHMAGYWMGAWINPVTQDSMATRHFLEQRFEAILRAPEAEHPALERALRQAIGAHRKGMPRPEMAWGWKNPRNMWVIPFLAPRFPGMRFIHLVRDGRDMALSPNRNLLRKHADFLLPGVDWRADPTAAQLDLWALGNLRCREAGRRLLGERYLLLRYEDLCSRPEVALAELAEFLGLDPELRQAALQVIRPSEGISRWRASNHPALQQPGGPAAEALQSFGYIQTEEKEALPCP